MDRWVDGLDGRRKEEMEGGRRWMDESKDGRKEGIKRGKEGEKEEGSIDGYKGI